MENEKSSVKTFESPFIAGYFTFIDWINRCVKAVGGVFLMLMTFSVFGSVVSRFFVNLSWSWIEEGAIFLLVWVVMLGATLAVRVGHMIAVEALVMKLSKRTWKIVKTIVILISLFYLAILLKAGIDVSITGASRISITLPWLRLHWVYMSVPICAVLMALNIIANLIELWTGKKVKDA